MAIIDGNYRFLNLNSIKDNLLEAFCIYFGEEYRKELETRIKEKLIYVPFHSPEYVNDYYLKYSKQYEEEVITRTIASLGLKDSEDVRNLFRGTDICNSPIAECLYYGGDAVAAQRKKIDEDVQLPITDTLGISTGYLGKSREALKRVYKEFLKQQRIVEQSADREIFKDMNLVEDLTIKATLNLVQKAVYSGLPVSQRDRDILTSKRVTSLDLVDMDSYGSLFTDNANYPGNISYFTSERDFEFYNGRNLPIIYQHRLRYLVGMGAKLKYLTEDELFSNTIPKESDSFALGRLVREYEYQLEHSPELFPSTETANQIENFRKVISKNLYSETLINRGLSRIGNYIGGGDRFFSTHRFKNKKFNSLRGYLAIDFDPKFHDRDFLSIIIHELLHQLSYFNFTPMHNDLYRQNRGLAVQDIAIVNNEVVEYGEDSALSQLEEYCTERQAQEILEIYESMYWTPKIPDSDIDVGLKKKSFRCLYDDYAFILKDFYGFFSPEIRKSKIDACNLYYNYEGVYEQGEKGDSISSRSIIDTIRQNLATRFKKDTGNGGFLDYRLVSELAQIVVDFNTYSKESSFALSGEDFMDEQKIKAIPKYKQKQLRDLKKRKTRVMTKIMASLNNPIVAKNRSKLMLDNYSDISNIDADTLDRTMRD